MSGGEPPVTGTMIVRTCQCQVVDATQVKDCSTNPQDSPVLGELGLIHEWKPAVTWQACLKHSARHQGHQCQAQQQAYAVESVQRVGWVMWQPATAAHCQAVPAAWLCLQPAVLGLRCFLMGLLDQALMSMLRFLQLCQHFACLLLHSECCPMRQIAQ